MYTLSLRIHLLLGNDSTRNRRQYIASIAHRFASVWAEPSFPSMCNPAEPKQSVKAFVTSPHIHASLISLGTAATDLRAH